jgi:hypothetical protein
MSFPIYRFNRLVRVVCAFSSPCFPSSSLPSSIFSPSPFPIHVRMLATGPNDGLKQTPVLLRNSEQCIGKVGSVGSSLSIDRVGMDSSEFESLVFGSS